jgi:hypothetical protein
LGSIPIARSILRQRQVTLGYGIRVKTLIRRESLGRLTLRSAHYHHVTLDRRSVASLHGCFSDCDGCGVPHACCHDCRTFGRTAARHSHCLAGCANAHCRRNASAAIKPHAIREWAMRSSRATECSIRGPTAARFLEPRRRGHASCSPIAIGRDALWTATAHTGDKLRMCLSCVTPPRNAGAYTITYVKSQSRIYTLFSSGVGPRARRLTATSGPIRRINGRWKSPICSSRVPRPQLFVLRIPIRF